VDLRYRDVIAAGGLTGEIAERWAPGALARWPVLP